VSKRGTIFVAASVAISLLLFWFDSGSRKSPFGQESDVAGVVSVGAGVAVMLFLAGLYFLVVDFVHWRNKRSNA
jgi:hypothetical protein